MAESQTWREGSSTRTRRRSWWQQRLDAGEIILCGAGDACLYKNRRIPAGNPKAWDLGHDDDHPRDHDWQRPWHRKCNRSDGQAKATAKRTEHRPGGSVFEGTPSGTALAQSLSLCDADDVVGFGVDDAVWDVWWLNDLRELPADATWPRFMSAPHPDAVGSLGVEFEWWCRTHRNTTLRWWQRLVARRLLEVDGEGRLVWLVLLLTLARQLGKSWLLWLILSWRLHQGDRFGRAQRLLHMSIEMSQVRDVMALELSFADSRPDLYATLDNNNDTSIEWLHDGSKWVRVVRGTSRSGGGYGQSGVAVAAVDEAWSIGAAVVDDGIEPTLVEGEQPWLVLCSTAHRKATSLMPDRRGAALLDMGTVEEPVLLLEWSSPRSLDLTDVAGWRMASPSWSVQREQMIRMRVKRALAGAPTHDPTEPDPIESLRAQWLNQWPAKVLSKAKGEPLVDIDAWKARELTDPAAGPITVVIEDDRHGGSAVAAAFMRGDGRVVVTGLTFEGVAAAARQAREWLAAVPGSRLLVGASMLSEPELRPMLSGGNAVGSRELTGGLALFRRAFAADRLWHDEDCADLTAQLADARVAEGVAGLSLSPSTGRVDLVRAAVWAVQAVYDAPGEPRID